MNLRDAEMILIYPRPSDEDSVDLCCPDCAGFWNSHSEGIHRLGDKYKTRYKYYVGHDNCILTQEGFQYTCPNGCGAGEPTYLNDVHEVCVMTPAMRYDYAETIVRYHKLETELSTLEDKLKQFECYYG